MKVKVVASPSQDMVIFPMEFINDLNKIDTLIGSSGRLFYKVYLMNGPKLIVCAKEYCEGKFVHLPRELMNFLGVREGDNVSIARHFGQLPRVKSLKFKPVSGSGFYRSHDIRSLIERALMDVPVLHQGVTYSIGETCKLELVELITPKGPEPQAVVDSEEEIALDFAPNDELYNLYLRELEDEKKNLENARVEEWERILKFRREGGLVFGISGDFLKYIYSKQQPKKEEEPVVDKWSTLKGGRQLLEKK